MHHGPFIIKNLVDPEIVKRLQKHSDALKLSPLLGKDSAVTNRSYIIDDPFFKNLHEQIFTTIAIKNFKENLKPSYHFVAFYEEGQGILPLHADKSQCYLTIDLCINHKEPWVIYINDEDLVPPDTFIDFLKLNETEQEYYRSRSKPYYLNPGDALFYNGTQFPHWRPKIQQENFCDVVLFHFVSADKE